jgi:hypothetical protein
MGNTRKQPTIQHLPAHRAQGLDEEVTAQPRPIADELALDASAEPELSVDPEDLGARFLSDAVEQGDFSPGQAWRSDSSLSAIPAGDQPLAGTNFVAGNSVWEQTVDLESRTQGAADQLREPAALSDDDNFDSQLERPERPDNDNRGRNSGLRIRVAASMPELSLLDRKGAEGDETMSPDLGADDLDEQGSHTQPAAGLEPESRADDKPRTSDMRPKAPLKAAARTLLDRGAGLWRRVAHRLQRHGR